MLSEAAEFVIQGVTVEGDIFQSADWVERLCNSLTMAGEDWHKRYSAYVRPEIIDGMCVMVVRVALQKADPVAFDMIKRYIAENRLMVRSGRGSRDAESIEPPVACKERRDPTRNTW